MKIIATRVFAKQISKLPGAVQIRFRERRDAFLKNPFSPILHNHGLHGDYAGCRSINITGDIRVIYRTIDPDTVQFMLIGTHSELYE